MEMKLLKEKYQQNKISQKLSKPKSMFKNKIFNFRILLLSKQDKLNMIKRLLRVFMVRKKFILNPLYNIDKIKNLIYLELVSQRNKL